ncbi:Calmodulin and related proteins (EF-Hand superfamily) [Forsythia ovata]|uniref:Calmodulin and related proteins (EF-Hand superfamily) n=1 Tax=Forsythia ovata TaxID=205694 RepID=A0ABD1P098_9LAMI
MSNGMISQFQEQLSMPSGHNRTRICNGQGLAIKTLETDCINVVAEVNNTSFHSLQGAIVGRIAAVVVDSPGLKTRLIRLPTNSVAHSLAQHELLFSRKKSQSIPGSESDPTSFSFQTMSSASSSDDFQTGVRNPTNGSATPISGLPAEEWADFELKQAFELIDRDGDGKIKKEELEALLNKIVAECE